MPKPFVHEEDEFDPSRVEYARPVAGKTTQVQYGKYFSIPEATEEPEHSAGWWLTSNDPQASAWRAQADGIAVQEVAQQYWQEHGEYWTAVPERIEDPPVKKAKYWDLPSSFQTQPKSAVDKYFPLPEE